MPYTLSSQLAAVHTLEEMASVMENRMKEYGFSGFVYWTHLRVPIKKLSNENSFMLSRGPAYLKAFEAIYLGKQLYVDDPIVSIAAESTQPFTTLQVRKKKTNKAASRRQRWLYSLEQRFGFVHDIYIPLHTPLRVQVFYAYFQGNNASYPEKIKKILPQLRLDSALFTSCIVDFVIMGGENELGDLLFSRREQECLTWMAKGRSNIEIGQILEISNSTVKFHVKNIMQKLSASNRTEAVAIAARSGWLPN